MDVLESAVQRYDRLLLDGILVLTEKGIAQWCFSCRTHLLQEAPSSITHEAIDRLARLYSRHSARCFLERHGQEL
ncbi:hypothetical protein [Naasia aerilata]|uniref:Uncharacterized protein n=1 Tax=Naasia aerilata TaxID=1162966 RepID=A0ABM8GAE7_9MICO|nr:hypothetical protein [Naasia aerilata]BDZ45157.1 hypothetical protein GCM10025866_10660 [Naasia aerilata]